MTPEAVYAEVVRSLTLCRARMAAIEKGYSTPSARQALLPLELAHELTLLAVLERLATGQKPQAEPAPSHWERLRKPEG